MFEVNSGFTSIDIAPDRLHSAAGSRESTGARVTLAFARHLPLPADAEVRVHYDLAENGTLREGRGRPKLTHTTAHCSGSPLYHYRFSHWIPPLSLMHFVGA